MLLEMPAGIPHVPQADIETMLSKTGSDTGAGDIGIQLTSSQEGKSFSMEGHLGNSSEAGVAPTKLPPVSISDVKETCPRCIKLAQGKPPATFGQIVAKKADLAILNMLCTKKRKKLALLESSLRGTYSAVNGFISVHVLAEKLVNAIDKSTLHEVLQLQDKMRTAIAVANRRAAEDGEKEIMEALKRLSSSTESSEALKRDNDNGSDNVCPQGAP